MTIRYCTPEWLDESARLYRASAKFEDALKKVTSSLGYRITAAPEWGIEKDILFFVAVNEGKLLDLGFISETKAREKTYFILSASPQVWKGILRKDKKFITEFMLGRVIQESGSKPALLKITPYANHFVDALTQFELQFPDEMSNDELAIFRADLLKFRETSGV